MSYNRERDVYIASLREIEDRMDHAENVQREKQRKRRAYFEAAVWVILFLLIAVAELMFG